MSNSNTTGRWLYGWFWFYSLVVVAASAFVYCSAAEVFPAVANSMPGVDCAYKAVKDSWLAEPIKWLVGILFCWRIYKVLVLHGWPIPLWMHVESGMDSKTGRAVTSGHIQGENEFWLGVVLRSHSTSDKIMRSRLAILIVRLGCILVVREGRLYFRHSSDGWNEYLTVKDAYKV